MVVLQRGLSLSFLTKRVRGVAMRCTSVDSCYTHQRTSLDQFVMIARRSLESMVLEPTKSLLSSLRSVLGATYLFDMHICMNDKQSYPSCQCEIDLHSRCSNAARLSIRSSGLVNLTFLKYAFRFQAFKPEQAGANKHNTSSQRAGWSCR